MRTAICVVYTLDVFTAESCSFSIIFCKGHCRVMKQTMCMHIERPRTTHLMTSFEVRMDTYVALSCGELCSITLSALSDLIGHFVLCNALLVKGGEV